MANIIKKKDFVELDYTGRLKNEGYIFDTTEEIIAKQNGLYNKDVKYGSIVACIGEAMILKGLDDALIGKEIGKEYELELNSGDAFGKRSAQLLKLVPMSAFRKQNMNPMPGLQINMDGSLGVIKTVSGGRVIVDFNHPLSGKDLIYHIRIKKLVEDKAEQILSIFELKLNMKREDAHVKINEANSAEITFKFEMPPDVAKQIGEYIASCVDVKEVVFLKKNTEVKTDIEKPSEKKEKKSIQETFNESSESKESSKHTKPSNQ